MSTDTDTDQIRHADRADRADDIMLPAQRGPVDRRVDHVRAHGRSCWWDFTQCRWQCSPDR